jgi:hypothetical protein
VSDGPHPDCHRFHHGLVVIHQNQVVGQLRSVTSSSTLDHEMVAKFFERD